MFSWCEQQQKDNLLPELFCVSESWISDTSGAARTQHLQNVSWINCENLKKVKAIWATENLFLTQDGELLWHSLHHNLIFAHVGHMAFKDCTLVDGNLRDEGQWGDQLLRSTSRWVQRPLSVQLVVAHLTSWGQKRTFLWHWGGES